MLIPGITKSVSAFKNGLFHVGLEAQNNNTLRIFDCQGQQVIYSPQKLGKSYNLSSVEGSESDASLCYIYDKTYYVCDVK